MGQIVNAPPPGEANSSDVRVERPEDKPLDTKCRALTTIIADGRIRQNVLSPGTKHFCAEPKQFAVNDRPETKTIARQERTKDPHANPGGEPKQILVRLGSLHCEKPRDTEMEAKEAPHEASKAMFEDEVATRLSLRGKASGGPIRHAEDRRNIDRQGRDEANSRVERNESNSNDWESHVSHSRAASASRSTDRAADRELQRTQMEDNFVKHHPQISKRKAEECREEHDRTLTQAEIKGKHRAEREVRIMEALRARAAAVEDRRMKVRAEADARAQQKRALFYASTNEVRRREEMEGGHGCFRPRFSDSERVRAKQEEDLAEEKKLQKRALFHFEALRKIEESYMQRKRNHRLDLHRAHINSKFPSSTRLNFPAHPNSRSSHGYFGDVDSTAGLMEPQRFQMKKFQKKGKGGLNALLTPVSEEKLSDQFQDMGASSPEDSPTDNPVAAFQRMKKAQMQAAEEQRAAAERKMRERRAQLKAAVEKAERTRALGKQAEQSGIKRSGECSRSRYCDAINNHAPPVWQTASCPPYSCGQNSYNYGFFNGGEAQGKRIKEVNEAARSKSQEENERQRRRAKSNERSAQLRTIPQDSIELYQRLSTPKRRTDKFDSRTPTPNHAPTSRFKSPLDGSRQQQPNDRFNTPPPSMPESSKFSRNRGFMSSSVTPQRSRVLNADAVKHIATWEQELRSARLSEARSQGRSKGKRVTIQEGPSVESRGQKTEFWGEDTLDHDDLSKKTAGKPAVSISNQSTTNLLGSQPQPDHYGSVEAEYSSESTCPQNQARTNYMDCYNVANHDDCICESRSSSRRERPRSRSQKEHVQESVRGGAKRRENGLEPRNWLGKFYSSLTSSMST